MNMVAWSDSENDAIVADYFAMLADDLAGRSYNKAQHNRALQVKIGRSRGSIEFKHQNISAGLIGLGESWIKGYKPAFNFQMALVDAIARYIAKAQIEIGSMLDVRGFANASPLWMTTAPTHKNTPPPEELERMQAIARKYDVAARDERNRILGKAGEERALYHERDCLRQAGRGDLAREVRWVSEEDGDGAGYDISSFAPDGRERLIEVKTTNGWDRTPFHISRNELAVSEAHRERWVLFRLYEFAREPKAFELRPPLKAHVSLTATSFQASF